MQQNREEIRDIMIAVNVIDGTYDALAKKIGLKENTLALLYALDDGQAHSQKEICEHWLISRTTLNTIVRECAQCGYIYLSGDRGKKEKTICLTEAGRAYARSVLPPVYELEQRAMDRTLREVSPEFVSSLKLFAKHLKDEMRRFTNEPETDI